MKILLMTLIFVMAFFVTIWPEFSVAQTQKQLVRSADLIGRWKFLKRDLANYNRSTLWLHRHRNHEQR